MMWSQLNQKNKFHKEESFDEQNKRIFSRYKKALDAMAYGSTGSYCTVHF